MSQKYKTLNRKLVLKYFWQVVKNYKLSFFGALIFVITATTIDVFIPLQYLKLWKVLSINDWTLVSQAQTIILLIFTLSFSRWIIRRFSGFCNSYFQASVMAGLREQAFSSMIGNSYSFFSNNFGGSLTQKINKYARSFEKLMDRMFNDGLPLLIRVIGTVIAIYTLVPKYALILGIFCLVFLLTSIIITRYKLKYDIIASEADTKTTGALSDSISNHSSIQLFNGHDYEKDRVSGIIKEQKKATLFNWYLWEGLNSIQSLYCTIVEFVIFWNAILDWRLGLMSLPLIILIQSYLGRLFDNLFSFASIVRTFHDAFADAQEMITIFQTPHEVVDVNEQKIESANGEVAFDNVSYIYDKNNTKIFDSFSLTIPAGQKIAIIGSSGAGKSTFVRLIMRLFDVTDGKIMIDGIDIKKITQQNLREQISFVPQEPVLFHRTLIENIRYGRRDATDAEVKVAARLAHCDEFIESLPNQYETFVGERGIKLSGGERQRVAIARAILKNAPILILDEATSSLDSHSELLIKDALHTLTKDKTTIVIAHRLSTIREMDRIVVILKGQIVEEGTHDELINREGGAYKNLWDIQAKGFEMTI